MEELYSAIIVGGGWAVRLSIRALDASVQFDLVALCNCDTDVLKALSAKFPGLWSFTFAQPMLNELPTGATYVSTYADSRQSLAIGAIQHTARDLLVATPLVPGVTTGQGIFDPIAAKGLAKVAYHNRCPKHHNRSNPLVCLYSHDHRIAANGSSCPRLRYHDPDLLGCRGSCSLTGRAQPSRPPENPDQLKTSN